MNYPACDTPNDPDARLCKNCGGPLVEDRSPPAKQRSRFLLIGGLIGVVLLNIDF
jgi:hypothetical protein